MAVVTRKRKSGKTYYVTYEVDGKKVWEPAGTDIREARRTNRRRLQELADGTYEAEARGRVVAKDLTVRAFLEPWLDGRKNRTAAQDATRVRARVLSLAWFAEMHLADLEPKHMIRLYQELLLARHAREDRCIGGKYATNIFAVVSTMCRDAQIAGYLKQNPCVLPRGLLVKKSKKRRPYPIESIAQLFACAALHPTSRAFAALALLTGMRCGEVLGRRWRDWDRNARPLGCLDCATQYEDQKLKTDEALAGEHARKIPVHPVLAEVLTWWFESGFELVHRRKPEPGDFIVPNDKLRCGSQSTFYQRFQRALKQAAVPNLSLHSTRNTFISMCRRGGARPDVLEVVTHNPRGTVIDQYTEWEWEPLCEAVLCLRLTPRETPPTPPPAAAAGGVRMVPVSPFVSPPVTQKCTPSGDASGDVRSKTPQILEPTWGLEHRRNGETTHITPESPWIWGVADPSRKTAVEGGVTAECAARHQESDSQNARWLLEAMNALYEGSNRGKSSCVG